MATSKNLSIEAIKKHLVQVNHKIALIEQKLSFRPSSVFKRGGLNNYDDDEEKKLIQMEPIQMEPIQIDQKDNKNQPSVSSTTETKFADNDTEIVLEKRNFRDMTFKNNYTKGMFVTNNMDRKYLEGPVSLRQWYHPVGKTFITVLGDHHTSESKCDVGRSNVVYTVYDFMLWYRREMRFNRTLDVYFETNYKPGDRDKHSRNEISDRLREAVLKWNPKAFDEIDKTSDEASNSHIQLFAEDISGCIIPETGKSASKSEKCGWSSKDGFGETKIRFHGVDIRSSSKKPIAFDHLYYLELGLSQFFNELWPNNKSIELFLEVWHAVIEPELEIIFSLPKHKKLDHYEYLDLLTDERTRIIKEISLVLDKTVNSQLIKRIAYIGLDGQADFAFRTTMERLKPIFLETQTKVRLKTLTVNDTNDFVNTWTAEDLFVNYVLDDGAKVMDIYTLARMFKTPNPSTDKMTDAILYVGDFHAENINEFLRDLGFFPLYQSRQPLSDKDIQCLEITGFRQPQLPITIY